MALGEVEGGDEALNFAKPPSSFPGKAGGVFVLPGLQSRGCSCANAAAACVAGDAAAEQTQPDLRDHHTVSWGAGRAWLKIPLVVLFGRWPGAGVSAMAQGRWE